MVITLLRKIRRETGLEDSICKYMYPMGCTSPKFYWLSKIHKTNTPLIPTVSSRDWVTYGVAKVLAKILKPLVGKSPHHVTSIKDFVERVSKVTFQPGECLCSYDMTFIHICTSGSSTQHDKWITGTGHLIEWKKCIVSATHNRIIRVLPTQYIFFLSKPVLWTGRGCSYGIFSKSHSS